MRLVVVVMEGWSAEGRRRRNIAGPFALVEAARQWAETNAVDVDGAPMSFSIEPLVSPV